LKYFFDNCISPRIVQMLRAMDVDAVPLRDEFPVNISDVELFARLSGLDMVFVGQDTHQRTRENEAAALSQAGVTAIYFGPFYSKLGRWGQAIWVLSRWQGIDAFAGSRNSCF
jgi:hypothetical protein